MKQKVIVILLGFVILIGISISLYLSFGSKGSDQGSDAVATETPSTSTQPENTGGKENKNDVEPTTSNNPRKPEVEPRPSNPTKIEDLYEKPKETEKSSISSTDAKAIEQKVRSSFRKFEFDAGLSQLQSVVSTTKNEGEGAILHQLNEEGTTLLNLLPAAEEENVEEMPDLIGITNMVGSIQDPENKLLAVLLINDRLRVQYIVDQASLSPLFDGPIRISGQKEVTGEELDKIRYVYEDASRLVRVDFSIESNQLYAYVLYFPDGTSKFFGIYSEHETKYKTVSEWKKFYEAVYQ